MNPQRHCRRDLLPPTSRSDIFGSRDTEGPPSIDNPDCGRLTAAIDLIHAQYSRPLSVPEMAQSAGINRFHFIRRFARTFGITPYQYLLRVRIFHAARLLAGTEYPPGTVARQVGFPTAGQMSRHFKLAFGMTPSWFRGTLRAAEASEMY